jgi:hypothetical protein
VARTVAAAFEAPVLVLRVPGARNYTLLARRDAALPLGPGQSLEVPEGELARALLGARELPGSFRVVGAHDGPGRVLTDLHAPVEALQLRALFEGRLRRREESGA